MSGCRLAAVCLLSAALLVPASGCAAKTAKKKKAKPAAAGAAAAVVEPEPEQLPEINRGSAITVDEGRLMVASPQGWARGPRSKDYLVRYTPSAQKTYPAITVTAADPPEGFAEVTAANHDAFVEAVAASLAETFTADGKSTLVQPPAAIVVGGHPGAAYAAPGRAKLGTIDEPIERSFLALVVNGRLVTVEVRAAKGKLDDKGRLAAKAVAAAVSPPQPVEPAASFAPPEPAAGAAPAAEQPAAADQPAEPVAAGEKP
jgi:hypothetical protein